MRISLGGVKTIAWRMRAGLLMAAMVGVPTCAMLVLVAPAAAIFVSAMSSLAVFGFATGVTIVEGDP